MAEKFVFTAPQALVAPAATVEVVGIMFHRAPVWSARFTLRDDKGRSETYGYGGDEARAIIQGLNKARLDQKSMERRILERLVADGKIAAAGTFTGSPD
jgi:hypothetical protein